MYKLCIIFLLTHLTSNVYAVDKISWTLSKPPMDLFRWETSKSSPSNRSLGRILPFPFECQN